MAEVDERFINQETKGINFDALSDYRDRFAKLYSNLNTSIPKSVEHPGLLRGLMIERFNVTYCGIDASGPGATGLELIKYNPKPSTALKMVESYLPLSVAEEMTKLPWHATFGLSYLEIGQLEFHEWYTLAKHLRDNQKEDRVDKLTHAVENLMKMFEGISTPTGPTKPNTKDKL